MLDFKTITSFATLIAGTICMIIPLIMQIILHADINKYNEKKFKEYFSTTMTTLYVGLGSLLAHFLINW